MSTQDQQADLVEAARRQQLEYLDATQKQQLEALSQVRDAAVSAAQQWERTAAPGEGAATPLLQAVPQPSPATVTAAHYQFMETMLKAQFDFARALLKGGAQED